MPSPAGVYCGSDDRRWKSADPLHRSPILGGFRMRSLTRNRLSNCSRKAALLIVSLLLYTVAARAQDLRAGYAKVDITPSGPVMLGGYDLRDAPSDGIWGNDRLYARALVFEASGVRVAFVECDVIEIQGHELFRRKISE